jgi:hypothetical protein
VREAGISKLERDAVIFSEVNISVKPVVSQVRASSRFRSENF